jgi:hypothetical protein
MERQMKLTKNMKMTLAILAVVIITVVYFPEIAIGLAAGYALCEYRRSEKAKKAASTKDSTQSQTSHA